MTKFNNQQTEDCTLNVKVIQLKQLMGQEKMSPELLPYQHLLVEAICKEISGKEREIAD